MVIFPPASSALLALLALPLGAANVTREVAVNEKVLPSEPTTARWVLDAAGLEPE